MFQYQVVKERLYHCDIGNYTSYGIRVLNSHGEELLFVSDVSVDKNKVEEFAALCEKEQPSLLHVMDLIYDLIG